MYRVQILMECKAPKETSMKSSQICEFSRKLFQKGGQPAVKMVFLLKIRF